MAGFGRTGKWFAVDHWDVVPDIITMAKGINSGYVPLGAMAIREPIAALGARQVLRRRTHVQRPSARVRRRRRVDRGVPRGGDRRARGASWDRCSRTRCTVSLRSIRRSARCAASAASGGSSSSRNRETREPLVPFNAGGEAAAPIARLAKAALERGLYLMTHWNVVMICPPLTITREELDEGIAILDDVLAIADEYYAD